MTRIVFTSILSPVNLREFFNNKYHCTIIVVQPVSVMIILILKTQTVIHHMMRKVKVSLLLLVHVVLMPYSIYYLKDRYLVKA